MLVAGEGDTAAIGTEFLYGLGRFVFSHCHHPTGRIVRPPLSRRNVSGGFQGFACVLCLSLAFPLPPVIKLPPVPQAGTGGAQFHPFAPEPYQDYLFPAIRAIARDFAIALAPLLPELLNKVCRLFRHPPYATGGIELITLFLHPGTARTARMVAGLLFGSLGHGYLASISVNFISLWVKLKSFILSR